MGSGTCSVCHTPQALRRGHVVAHVTQDELVNIRRMRCNGSERPPLEKRTKARERAKAKREHQIASVRDEALVVLDAVTEQRDVEKLFPGRLWVMVNIAIGAHRLKWPRSRAERPWRWIKRNAASTMFIPKLGDIYCVFCGELLWSSFERLALPTLRGFAMTPPHKLAELGGAAATVYGHTTPCALQCLAGLREYASPNTRRLPHDAREG